MGATIGEMLPELLEQERRRRFAESTGARTLTDALRLAGKRRSKAAESAQFG